LMKMWTLTTLLAPNLGPAGMIRSRSPVLVAKDCFPSADLTPMAVVEARLSALQQQDVSSWFDFATVRVRRLCAQSGKGFEEIIRGAPALKPLLGCEKYEVLSTLQLEPQRWTARVRVENRVGRMPFSVIYTWELLQQSEGGVGFDLGQCILHKEHGFRGVVVGWDTECRQSEQWCQATNVDSLRYGRNQPFYMLLVDGLDETRTAYVPEEALVPTPTQQIRHPSFAELFDGEVNEATATWQPTPFLRQQYPCGLEGCWLVDKVGPELSEFPEHQP